MLRRLSIIAVVALIVACSSSNNTKEGKSDDQDVALNMPASQSPEAEIDSTDQYVVTGSRIVAQELHAPAPALAYQYQARTRQDVNRERYAEIISNPVQQVIDSPVSTFSIDVDTGAYANVRRILNQGSLPPSDAVRIEEMINYFSYDYPLPDNQEQPFSVSMEMAPSPWNQETYLLQVGLRGYEVETSNLPPSNLVFLVDVSGSMQSPDKLELLKKSLRLLTRQLRAQDQVSMVVYAGAAGVVLEPTSGDQKAKILSAIDQLEAGGSTHGSQGIELAYRQAEQGFVKKGINRVILATDGDFNVGIVDQNQLEDLIKNKRKKGIALTTLGFGTGNYNDALMEQMADVGNGNYAYVDSLLEARKVLGNELGSTLLTIASDVKIQIEFNPDQVAEYRLLGYENRLLAREDFNNDKVDAGEIGAGHTVTALYEITLADNRFRFVDPLRYGSDDAEQERNRRISNELAFVKLRYKLPGESKSQLISYPLEKNQLQDSIQQASENLRFAASVAAFGQYLRQGQWLQDYSLTEIEQLARSAKGQDNQGIRSEFIQLVGLTGDLEGNFPELAQKP